MILLFLTTACHLVNPQRGWKAESRSPSTVTHPPVPCVLFPCFPMPPWPGTASAPLLRSPPWPDGHGHEQQHGEEPTCARAASGCSPGRRTTEKVVRLWKRLPKEVMESTSGLITLEPLSCKKVSTQRGNSSRTDVLTFLSVMWDKG